MIKIKKIFILSIFFILINTNIGYTQNIQGKYNSDQVLGQYCAAKSMEEKSIFTPYDPVCDHGGFFGYIMKELNIILEWLVKLSFVVAAIFGFYAGFLFLSSTTTPSNREEAKNLLGNIIIGLAIILIAWLVVNFIVKLLTNFTGLNQ